MVVVLKVDIGVEKEEDVEVVGVEERVVVRAAVDDVGVDAGGVRPP